MDTASMRSCVLLLQNKGLRHGWRSNIKTVHIPVRKNIHILLHVKDKLSLKFQEYIASHVNAANGPLDKGGFQDRAASWKLQQGWGVSLRQS
jgi:hypothetical protein